MKKISVIIPLFNQEKFIEQCIDSVLSQSHFNLEVIIVDDGSQDNSVQIVKKLKNLDQRIILLQQENKGAGAARNYGLSIAQGEFIHFLDSDDWIENNAYTELVSLAHSSESDVIVFLYKRYNQATSVFREVKLFEKSYRNINISDSSKKSILLDTAVVPWNKFYKKSFLDQIKVRFDELPVANDRAFHYRTITKAKNITLYDKFLINYRDNNPNSLMGINRTKKFDSIIAANENILKELNNIDQRSKEIIYEANFKDIQHSYERLSSAEEKLHISFLISKYLSKYPYPNQKSLPIQNKWTVKYKVWRQMKSKGAIPIVLATNDKYALYLYVTLQSISQNLEKNSICDIYILHSGLDIKYINLFENTKEFSNLNILTLNVKSLTTESMSYSRAHYSPEMYYRLLIPEIFDMYKKVIYLDCDLVVNRSINELYSINIDNFLIAGVQNFCNSSMSNWIKNKIKVDPSEYINSGVMIFNTEKFNSLKTKEKCLDFLKKHDFLACPDQDMFNSACAGMILKIDEGWNYQWHHGFFKYKQSDTIAEHLPLVREAEKKSYIVHYTSGAKAWSHPLYEGSYHFWNYARKTKIHGEILKVNLRTKIDKIFDLLEKS